MSIIRSVRLQIKACGMVYCGLAVRTAAAWHYVLGVKEDIFCPKHVELILKINKYCYLLHPVGLDFITLPTLKMPDGQTQIRFTL
jgi:hypothetical protein